MKSSFMMFFVTVIFAGLILSITGCSGDDNSTNSGNQNDPDDPPGTIVLLSVDFESTISGWDGIPHQYNITNSSDWTWQSMSGTKTILNEGSVEITSEYSKSGSKSLAFEAKNGLYSTFSHTGSSYSIQRNWSPDSALTTRLIRKFSLLDYSSNDQASISLFVKPIYITKSTSDYNWNAESSFAFRMKIYGAHGSIKDTILNYSYLVNNLGSWKEVKIDMSSYTSWEDDISIMLELLPRRVDENSYAYYYYDFCYSAYVPTCDRHYEGDSSKCMVVIDDLEFKVFPSTGE